MKHYIFILLFVFSAFGVIGQNRAVNENTHFVRFYPNPASTVINFDLQKGYDLSNSFAIFNFMGKKVFESKNASSRFLIDLEGYYRGIYIFQVRNKYGQLIESGKFQVVK